MRQVRLILISFAAVIAMSIVFGDYAYSDPVQLAEIERDLKADFANIGHITPQQFASMQQSGARPVLLDVRPQHEFEVGHIEGAIQISPWASASRVEQVLAKISPDQPVIFYCSVGVRSSRLAERARQRLSKAGITNIYNLSGGVFAWHNEQRPLIDALGPTEYVHPYDRPRQKMLIHQDLVSKRPQKRQ